MRFISGRSQGHSNGPPVWILDCLRNHAHGHEVVRDRWPARAIRVSRLYGARAFIQSNLAAHLSDGAHLGGHGKARCTTNATVSGSEWHSFSRRAA
eukprot:scaffold107793_cov69-Phaeocystis_antarctica.AAC.5